MNGEELFAQIASLPGSQHSGASGDGVLRSCVVNGTEYCLTKAAEERRLRAAWKRRQDGEVAALIATDVLSEGQNLQQAEAVISYDMPWNPQRVVQRNGRVIRLKSEHDEVQLTTMLPEEGALEELLGLEARVRGKIRAASGVYGMESEVIEDAVTAEQEAELKGYAERLADGDETLLEEADESSGAFVGEQLRRIVDRALSEGEVDRILRLPWGIGACFRQTPHSRSTGRPGVFFAVRTPAMAGAEEGYRYWRYVEIDAAGKPSAEGEVVTLDLEMLRRIDPAGSHETDVQAEGVDLEAAWNVASASIVAEHNKRADLRGQQESIGPRQRWALAVLRDPTVGIDDYDAAETAIEALAVERSSAVRRALGEIEERLHASAISRDKAAGEVIELVADFGLRGVERLPIPEQVVAEDLGVVCWMVVLPSA